MTENAGKVATEELAGRDLLDQFGAAEYHRERGRNCPGCDQNVSTVALVNLVYTFEPCRCKAFDYTHLIERVGHRACFGKAAYR